MREPNNPEAVCPGQKETVLTRFRMCLTSHPSRRSVCGNLEGTLTGQDIRAAVFVLFWDTRLARQASLFRIIQQGGEPCFRAS